MENVGSPNHGNYLQGYTLSTLRNQNLNFHRSKNLNLINNSPPGMVGELEFGDFFQKNLSTLCEMIRLT
jgi:hypothetical protein